jgi:hypothetical protein
MPPRNKRSSRAPQEVFISYAHQDLPFVRKLAADLRRRGIHTWYSKRHVAGAQQWLDDIGAALDRCDWLIVILTPAAVASLWVKREVGFAFNEKRYNERVIPIALKKCKAKKLAWPLVTIQSIDADPYADALHELLAIWGIGRRR